LSLPVRRTVATLAASVLAIALVALLVFGVLQTSDDTSLDQAVARGERPVAPELDVALPLLDGDGARTIAQLGDGGWIVVNFFASWCGPCEDEAPLLNELQRRLGGRGTIVGVSWNDSTDDARAFVRKHGVRFPVVRDVNDDVGRAYGLAALPETFVVDPEGRVVALKRSQLTDEWVAAELDPLIGRTQEAG
jgi:cytochrome c biogenesis protein CcmG/thiol:disulfide interchange protein DsbE